MNVGPQEWSTFTREVIWVGTRCHHGSIVPNPPALPLRVEVDEFGSGGGLSPPLVWLSVHWFSLMPFDFKVKESMLLPRPHQNTWFQSIWFLFVFVCFQNIQFVNFLSFSLFLLPLLQYIKERYKYKRENLSFGTPAGFVFDNYVNSTCKYLGG